MIHHTWGEHANHYTTHAVCTDLHYWWWMPSLQKKDHVMYMYALKMALAFSFMLFCFILMKPWGLISCADFLLISCPLSIYNTSILVRDCSAVRQLFVRLAGAVGRQCALHKENSRFADPTPPGRHISTFRGYQILFSIWNPYMYINRFTINFSIHS